MYKMLIVDDEKAERDCICYLIKSSHLPLELKEAESAFAAMEILKEWHADILFTDVQMPVTTGLELAKQAAELLPDIKTVIFSSYAEFEYARTAMTLGITSYILKPVVPKELEATLQDIIRQLAEEKDSKNQQDAQQSYLLQYALQNCAEFSPETTRLLNEFHQTQTDEAQDEPDDNSLLATIKQNLSDKDATELLKHLDLLFQKYQKPANQSRIFAKFVFSNLITIMYPFLPNESMPYDGSGRRTAVKALDAMITELYIQQDILEIIGTIQSMAETIIKSYDTAPAAEIRREVLITQDYINRNYSHDLSVEMLASLVYLTPDYLSRLFRKSAGKSISQYIRQVRMEKASELLRTTNRKVIDIGTSVGYANYSYFCQSFREYFGKSPEKYRQEESQ